MRMNATDLERVSADDCILIEKDVPVIDLDASGETNNSADCDGHRALDASILKICFKDAAVYNELNNLIAKCVKNALFYLQKSVICTEDSSKFTITFNETTNDDNDLFIVDAAPSESPEIVNVVPEYEVLFNDKSADPVPGESNSQKANQNACFNCDGDHSIKDCTKPKDLAKIKQNRAKFTNNRLTYERYHVDVEQRFGHLAAGELSKDLRSALGLREKDLPMHIYRMRMLGYPPGWLENAKVSGSGLTLFGSEVSSLFQSAAVHS